MSTNKRSVIWQNFTEVNRNKVICDLCSIPLSTLGGSTGNLKRHLKAKHPYVLTEPIPSTLLNGIEYIDNNNLDSPVISPSSSKSPVLEQNTTYDVQANVLDLEFLKDSKAVLIQKSKLLNEQLIKMIVNDYQRFKLVEDPEFKKFVHLLCPEYTLPSRKTITTNLIPQLMQTTIAKVESQLTQATAVCLTTDEWTSINNENLVAITAHYIDKNETKLYSNLLGCIKFEDNFTGLDLAGLLKDVVDKWGLTNKIEAIVTGIANNISMASAIRLCGWHQIVCFTHKINFVIQAGLNTKNIACIIEKVKSIIEYFKRSSLASEKIHLTKNQLNLFRLNLKQDDCMPWISTSDMIECVITNKESIISTIPCLDDNLNAVSAEEWELLTNLEKILTIFSEIKTEISSQEVVSISKIILFVGAINKHLNKFQEISSLQKMVSNLKMEMDKQFKNIEDNDLFAEATFLDPRFKYFGFSNANKFDKILAGLRSQLRESTEMSETPQKKILNYSALWSDFDSKVEQLLITTNPSAAGIAELENFLNEPLIERTENPLIWWNSKKNIYPKLYEIVLKRLCLSTTSIPCKRIFSEMRQIISDKRRRFSSEKVSQFLFLNSSL